MRPTSASSVVSRATAAFGLSMLIGTGLGCECQGPLPPFDPPHVACDIPDAPPAPAEPCEGAVLLRSSYPRFHGPPSTDTITITAPRDGTLCIRAASRHVSTAVVSVDDAEQLRPADFPFEGMVERTMAVSAGEHVLNVRVASMPGALLELEVRFASGVPDPVRVEAADDLISLDRRVCANANLQLDALEPPDGDTLAEQMSAAGMPAGRLRIRGNAYGLPTFLSPLPDEELGLGPTTAPDDVVFAWLAIHASLMGATDRVSFVVDHDVDAGEGATVVVLQEVIAALPVVHGALAITVVDGQVRQVVANVVPDEHVVEGPAFVTAADAVARAHVLVPELDASAGTASAVVWDRSGLGMAGSALAWLVADDRMSVLIDAQTGALREQLSRQSSLDIAVLDSSGTRFTVPARPDVDNATCEAETVCSAAVGGVLAADQFYRSVFGVDGWCEDMTGAGCSYRVEILGNVAEASNLLDADSDPRHLVSIGTPFLTGDTIAHEFGHGYLTNRDVGAATNLVAGTQGYLGEHAGDLIAMMTRHARTIDATPDVYRMDARTGFVRDHSILQCDGYVGGICDRVTFDAATGPDFEGCREYVDMRFLANLNGIGEPHLQSCPYSRLYFLLTQQGGPIQHEGVFSPGGISRELAATMFHRALRASEPPMLTAVGQANFWGYPFAYHNAIASVLDKCAGSPPPAGLPECLGLPTERLPRAFALSQLSGALAAPLFALGFWSEPTTTSLRATLAPSAVAAPAPADRRDPAGLYVFHVDVATNDVRFSVFADERASSASPEVSVAADRLGSPGTLSTTRPVAVAAGAADLWVAVSDAATSTVVLAHRHDMGMWSTSTFPFARATNGLSVLDVGSGRALVAAADTTGIRTFFSDSSAAIDTVATSMSGAPALVSVTVDGTPHIIELHVNGTRELEARELTAGRFGPVLQGLRALSQQTRALEFSCATPVGASCTIDSDCGCPALTCAGTCQPRACTTDVDCTTGLICHGGFCRDLSTTPRQPISAVFNRSAGLSVLAGQADDGSPRLEIFAFAPDPSFPGVPLGVTRTVIPIVVAGGVLRFDDYAASRQVVLEPRHANGFSVARIPSSSGDRWVRYGLDALTSTSVTSVWRLGS